MEESEYRIGDPKYFSRIVMMIIFTLQLILFIIFIVLVYRVRDNMNKLKASFYSISSYNKLYGGNYYPFGSYSYYGNSEENDPFVYIFQEQVDGISACMAFFVIGFIFFLVEFIIHFGCEESFFENKYLINVFVDFNHNITLISFVVAQFLYVITCLLIPIYLDRTITFRDYIKSENFLLIPKDKEFIDSSVKIYVGSLIIAFSFLFIFIFLYFIILNLYIGICCDMRRICKITDKCMGTFFRCFADNFKYVFTGCKRADKSILELEEKIEKKKEAVAEITCQVQNAMKENIKLRVDNIEYL